MDEEFLKKAQELVIANLENEQFNVGQLAGLMSLSRVNVYRKIHRISGKSVSQFIREVRLNKAMEMLRNQAATAAEISYQVGFGSPSYFNKCFHEHFGFPPGEVKNRKIEEPLLKPYKESAGRRWIRTGAWVLAGSIVAGCLIFWQKGFWASKASTGSKPISIAVIPFTNLSSQAETDYFSAGVMEAILIHLSKISEFQVPSRTSVEQFRNADEMASSISRKLNVRYILKGSIQRYENTVRISLYLIDGERDRNIWSDQYDRKYADLLKLESDLAKTVAKKLKANITTVEKLSIEKVPTKNMLAYDLFLRARDNHMAYWLDNTKLKSLENATTLYHRALEYDPAYAQVWSGLSLAYLDKYSLKNYASDKDYLDSAMMLADKALSYNDRLEEAYWVKAGIYSKKRDLSQSLEMSNKCLACNPSFAWAYMGRGGLYEYELNDIINALKDYHHAIALDHSPLEPKLISQLGDCYNRVGLNDRALYYYTEAFRLNNDTIMFEWNKAELFGYSDSADFQTDHDILKRLLAKDPSNFRLIFSYMYACFFLNSPDLYDATQRFQDWEKKYAPEHMGFWDLIGYGYWLHGDKHKAEECFSQQMKESLTQISRYVTPEERGPYVSVAGNYSFHGDKEKAIQYLVEADKQKFCNIVRVVDIRKDPFFNPIRNDPRFKKIMNNIIRKHMATRSEVLAWLKKTGQH